MPTREHISEIFSHYSRVLFVYITYINTPNKCVSNRM